jgi:hypothetical protein
MTLTDPRQALAEQSSFVGYLMGLASMARAVHELAADDTRRVDPPSDADDFVHALLGIASLGEKIELLGKSAAGQQNLVTEATGPTTFRWLR